MSTDDLGHDSFINVAKTSMSSKLVGVDADFFSEMVVNAALAIKRNSPKGETKVPIKAVNILKAHGGNMKQSQSVHGYALNCTVACEGKHKISLQRCTTGVSNYSNIQRVKIKQ